MHIAILMANTDESDFAQAHPKDGEKWQIFLKPFCPQCEFSIYAVKDGIFPIDITEFDGLIITGSPASVHDADPWLADLFALIQEAVVKKIPLYGACFGHQAIAIALGGKVCENPNGWVFGTTKTVVTDMASYQKVGPIYQYAAHIEQVTQLPENAQIIIRNSECPIGGFAIENHVLTTQYHPEMTDDFIAALVDELADTKPKEVISHAKLSITQKADNRLVAQAIIQFLSNVQS